MGLAVIYIEEEFAFFLFVCYSTSFEIGLVNFLRD